MMLLATKPPLKIPPLLGLTSEDFVTRAQAHGVAKAKALCQYRQLFRQGTIPNELISTGILEVSRSVADGQATKFILQANDGLELESVVLPIESRTGRQRCTLCVSSQIGCAMGCTFCETAQMGRLRHCLPEVIVAR